MKPMLAATPDSLSGIHYPIYASPKLDGVRGVIVDGQLLSRSLKPIPNSFVSSRFSKKKMSGLDGELIFGSPTAKDVYRQTVGSCSRHTGEPDVKFYVFDSFAKPQLKFATRIVNLDVHESPEVVVVKQKLISNAADLMDYETVILAEGYEGLILRSPDAPYKFGRSRMSDQGMVKLKRFVDDEAEVLGVYEEMHNTNEAQTNELGRTFRSSDAAGLVGKGTTGGFLMKKDGVLFKCGTGLTDAEAAEWWARRSGGSVDIRLETEVLTYWPLSKPVIGKFKHFPVGAKDRPRHPVWLGPRERWDL